MPSIPEPLKNQVTREVECLDRYTGMRISERWRLDNRDLRQHVVALLGVSAGPPAATAPEPSENLFLLLRF